MPLDPLRPKWESFGWRVWEIDGHNYTQIIEAVQEAKADKKKPSMIIARTTKGKGVSFMENKEQWHGKPPDKEEFKIAIKELQDGV
jgi:transketolase